MGYDYGIHLTPPSVVGEAVLSASHTLQNVLCRFPHAVDTQQDHVVRTPTVYPECPESILGSEASILRILHQKYIWEVISFTLILFYFSDKEPTLYGEEWTSQHAREVLAIAWHPTAVSLSVASQEII
jgi:hypothetical protein